MTKVLTLLPLTAAAFAPYGDIIDVAGTPDKIINAGMCDRYHDRARLDFSDGRAGLSLFDAKARHLPYHFDLLERHPDGSQAFVPVSQTQFMVIVADDIDGTPTNIQAFLTGRGQAINLHRGVWHGVLAPLDQPGQFVVIDRIGAGANLEEYRFDEGFVINP